MPVTDNELTLKFYNSALDAFLLYAVIIARYDGKWVFCKHKERNTLEIPGGKREKGETIIETAKRELYEETGAKDFSISPLFPYSVTELKKESFGMVFLAEIATLATIPASEMEKIILLDSLPELSSWTYPTLQPLMIEKYLSMERGNQNDL